MNIPADDLRWHETFHEKLERVLRKSSRAAFWTDYYGDDPKLMPTVQYVIPDDEEVKQELRSLLSDDQLQTQLTGDPFEKAVVDLDLWEQIHKQGTCWRKKVITIWQSYTPMPKFQALASQVGIEGQPSTAIADEHIGNAYWRQPDAILEPEEEA